MAFLVVSCKQDGESAEMKRLQEKKAVVEALQAELDELRVKVADAKIEPPEVSLEDLETELEEKTAAIAKLKSEFSELSKNEKEAREKLANYRRKYPLSE